MNPTTLIFFCTTLFVVATLYSCVGQSGASGFIAAMAFFGFVPALIKPTALILNILVSAIVAFRFWRAGYFRWRLFWPFAVLSIPCAAVGGFIRLPNTIFNPLLGSVLLIASFPFFGKKLTVPSAPVEPPLLASSLAGGGIGLLSGLTGIGEGILITPLILLLRWAETKPAAALSAMFILVNSLAAMAGHLSSAQIIPPNIPLFAASAGLGGLVGSHLGSSILPASVIRKLLGVTLFIAGLKSIAQ